MTYRRNTGLNTFLERPKVQLIQGSIVNIGRNAFDGRSVGVLAWISLSLLLVSDVVFGTCLDPGILSANNGIGE